MSRPTADIVADLRRFIDYYGCDPGVPMSAVDEANEAADRLAELDAEVRKMTGERDVAISALRCNLAEFDAARPVCPTCGGTGEIALKQDGIDGLVPWPEPCPDCVDGKMPLERMVAIVNAVFEYADDQLPVTVDAYRDYLRSVRP